MKNANSTLGIAALGALLVLNDPGIKRRNRNTRNSALRRSQKERMEREAEAEAWIAEVKKRKSNG